MDQNLSAAQWTGTATHQVLSKGAWNVSSSVQDLGTKKCNATPTSRDLSWTIHFLSLFYNRISVAWRIQYIHYIVQCFYDPTLAIVGVPLNFVTILILSRGKCDLSKCVTLYLVAMAVADLLVIIFDLIFRHIPIVYRDEFHFLFSIPMCNIHAVVLYAATDCSVWFTVSFTFDRLIAICCQKLKSKYCTERTAAMALGTVTALSCMKNISWYFMLMGNYYQINLPWFCLLRKNVLKSVLWVTIEFLHHILTPCCPFILILLFNAITVKNILLTSRARRRLHASRSGRDPEMENRRKSINLLFILSANFIILWSTLMVFSIWYRMFSLGYYSVSLLPFVLELGFMLQLRSCCTNTGPKKTFRMKQMFTFTSAAVADCARCSQCGILYIREIKRGLETDLWSI
ncbi:probable G-protein coupled receptor 139 [Stegostoma tigrinum]|uniref:probable G-protein coupled receptor 139 n=1 Tax=Stegostoma tigrinum TaxID=3053191 RepID=UPI00286FCAA4|nr:probable G-protein coupled receptor 139 [Stegostoma tigrinum]